jgi:hypothetical protein
MAQEVKVLSRHLSGGNEENHGNLSQDSWPLGQDLNPGPPKYKARVLTRKPSYTTTNNVVCMCVCVRACTHACMHECIMYVYVHCACMCVWFLFVIFASFDILVGYVCLLFIK